MRRSDPKTQYLSTKSENNKLANYCKEISGLQLSYLYQQDELERIKKFKELEQAKKDLEQIIQ